MRNRFCAVAVMAVLGFGAAVLAQTPVEPATPERPSALVTDTSAGGARQAKHAVATLLRKRVESVDWSEAPFSEVIEWLENESDGRVNVIPRWSALGREGVDSETAVTVRLKNTIVESVLNEVLLTIKPEGELAYRGQENVLRISTRADFDTKMITRVYDISDIVIRIPDFGQNSPQIDLQQAGGRGGGGGGGGGRSVFTGGASGSEQGESGEQAEQAMKTRLEEMARIIQETIAVDTWDLGQVGGRGRIRVHGRYMIIYNTIDVHEMIGGPVVLGG